MDFVLVLLIGVAVGFSLGVYVARHYKVSPRPEIWKQEIIREISSHLRQHSQELNNANKTLTKLVEGLADEISRKLQATQADLKGLRSRLVDSHQDLLQSWSRDLLQAISVKFSEHNEQLNDQRAILENLVKETKDIYQRLQIAIQSSPRLEISQTTDQSSQNEQVASHETPEPRLTDDVPRDKEEIAAAGILEVDVSKIESFLSSKNIKIKSIDVKEKEEKLDQIAAFMGNRYSLIKRFYGMIKSNMNSGNSFSINLKDEPQQVISSTCQVAKELHGIAFLEEYRYFKAPRYLLVARPSRSSQALNFLSGKWLERYVRDKLICLAASQAEKIDFSYITNAQVTLPNGADFEMDLFFHINDQFYWVESKTGEYQDKVQKYSKIASDLGLQKNQVFMVLTDVSQDVKTGLSSLYHLSVISVDEVEATFEGILKSHL
ncbi:hypothetical protein [Synechococcus sp. H55.10]|uniref:hypothetical protein n=1 Tax=Synechococcus sp. H55.10 TaxID=2964503 RepID=UPI0039C6A439